MLPVSIITGFLGSGKTTLLNRILQHASLGNSLVIINEFGQIGIDHLLVSMPAENMRLLANGCLCCEVRGDLVETLTDVSRKRATGEIPFFDRILIETTGLADPVPIMQTIVTDCDLSPIYHLDTVVCVLDAVHALTQLETLHEARKQLAVSDVLLLSKTDLVTSAAVREVEAAVKTITGGAALLPVLHGEIDPALVFRKGAADECDRDLARWLGQVSPPAVTEGKQHYFRHAGDIRTFTVIHEGRVSELGLGTWLSMLASFRGAQLLRVKGIVNVSGKPYVINAVQTVIHKPTPLDHWPDSDERTRIVFIVRGLERAAIEKSLAALTMTDSFGSAPRFDPAAYARFRDAAQHFVG